MRAKREFANMELLCGAGYVHVLCVQVGLTLCECCTIHSTNLDYLFTGRLAVPCEKVRTYVKRCNTSIKD